MSDWGKIPMRASAKAALNQQKTLFVSKSDLNLRNKRVKRYTWNITLYGADTLTLQEIDQEYLDSFEIRCWGRIEEIIWANRVRNGDILHRIKEERNILHTIKRNTNRIGHVLRRNYVLIHVTEGNIRDGKTRKKT
jgi:hypothetical protein